MPYFRRDGERRQDRLGGTRLIVGYVVVALFLVAAVAVSVSVGRGEQAQPAIAGFYESDSACLGERFNLAQSGQFVDVGGDAGGKLRLRDDQLTGDRRLRRRRHVGRRPRRSPAQGVGDAARRHGRRGAGKRRSSRRSCPSRARPAKPAEKRSGEETFGRLMLAIAAVILAARLVGVADREVPASRA